MAEPIVRSRDYEGPNRRQREPLQRDWLGHSIYFFLTLIVAGGTAWVTLNVSVASLAEQIKPVAAMQSTMATLMTQVATDNARLDRDERDIGDLRTSTVATTTTLIDINKQLAVVGEQVRQLTTERPRR